MRTIAIHTITLFWATVLLVSCREDTVVNADMLHAGIKVSLPVSNPADAEGGTSGTAVISKVSAYRFEGGILAEMQEGLVPDASGICLIPFIEKTGTLYCLANIPEGVTARHLEPGVTSLDNFRLLTASDREMTFQDHIALTGDGEIIPDQTTIPLKRTVARVDLSTPPDVQVHRVKISRIADRGFLSPQTDKNMTPQGVQYKDSVFEFSGPPVDITRTLTYLCEQENATLEFEIYVYSGGGFQKLRAHLPDKIVRNTVYTLKVRGSGATLDVDILSEDWNYGTVTESGLESANLIDMEASVLPEGVRLNDAHDTLRVSFPQNTFDLALSIEEGARVEVNGRAQGVTTAILPSSPALPKTVHVNVTKIAKLLSQPEESVFLDVVTDDAFIGRIVLIFEKYPVQLTGRLDFKNTYEFDFENYIDGEIGVLTLPEGWTASSSTDNTGDPWMILKPVAGNPQKMRILAGWHPNDPHADGRIQEAGLILSDGKTTDEYTVKRRNWGLPVVNIDGTWWCKYNLRGNAVDFAGQLLPKDDSLTEDNLYAHLQHCPEDELLGLLGHQYQGGYPQGLPLAWDAAKSKFYYEGMRNSVPGFAVTADSLMVPPGYRVPRREDFLAFSQNNNFNLGKPGTRSFTNAAGRQVTVSIAMRNVSFSGHNYGLIGFYEFQVGNTGGRIVLCGLGYQLNTTAPISPTTILLATKGKTDWCWRIMGLASSNNSVESWISFSIYREIQTRTLRAVKEPVEYIY